jgi:hypothetical protein
MANLSPEQRRQLARVAAAARWQQNRGSASIALGVPTRHQKAFVAKMGRELAVLRQQREMLDRRIAALIEAIASYGASVSDDSNRAISG